ncbi:hypothetical protein C0058_00955 [Pseudomonas sp. NC02]|nr:hypothetical protein C0058_00955 [Pseudomonas sp. NC02]QBQ08406.1 hypothetical protein DCC84_00980 [Pseudomonas sp. SXM-1]
MFDRPLSRASPLPHLTEYIHWNAVKCGSGLAREEALTAAATPATSTHPETAPASSRSSA